MNTTLVTLISILALMSTLASIVLSWLWTTLKTDIKEIKEQKYVTQKNMDERFEAIEKQFITELRSEREKLSLTVENINQKIELSHANLLSEIKGFFNNKKILP